MHRRWLGYLAAALAAAASLWAYPRLPPRVATHWNALGQPDGFAPRLVAVLGLPLVMVALRALMGVLPAIDPKGDNYRKFADTFWLIVNGMLLFLGVLQLAVIGYALGAPVPVHRVGVIGVGLLTMVIGNYLTRVEPNWFVGIRTPWTLSSERVWRKTHRWGGRLWVGGGLVIAATAFVPAASVLPVVVATGAVMVVVPVLGSYLWWRQERSGRGGGSAGAGGSLLAVAWLVAAAVPAAGVPGLSAQQVASGAYLARRGEIEVSRERYRFDGKSLAAEVEVAEQGFFFETWTSFDSTGSARQYRVAVRAGAGGPVVQQLSAEFGDSVRWSMTSAGSTRNGGAAVGRPVAVIQRLVFSQIGAALRLYDRSRGGRQVVSAWRPEGGAVVSLAMELGPDTGRVELGGMPVRVALDSSGWPVRLDLPAEGIVVTRQSEVSFRSRAVARADTVPPGTVEEEPYLVEAGGVRLLGTLALPRVPGPVPVALLVGGSGAVDRNGNAPPALRSNLYAQVAWRLAERGIASLRYDKRGVGQSTAGVDLAMTTFDDFAEDVLAAAAALAADPRFRSVVIVGHSEGGWLAVRAALRGAPVRGIALLAAAGRPLLVVLREQLAQQLDSAALAQYDAAMAAYVRGELPVGVPPVLQPLFRPVNQRFTASAAAYDVLAELRRLDLPVLVLQGGRDVQVSVPDAERLAAAARRAELRVLPDANHLFKAAERADRLSQLALYLDPSAPVEPELVDVLVDWIGRVSR